MAEFRHIDLRLVRPTFDSGLTDLILELDHLRKKQLDGSTPSTTFRQLKGIFHMLESIGSARIEGNNTTVLEYIETKIGATPVSSTEEGLVREIRNMEQCLEFIDRVGHEAKINRAFISELHKMVVDSLQLRPHGEGDETPGVYRTNAVRIKNSELVPPEPIAVGDYMDELFGFINQDDPAKYNLLKIATAHHRFTWIHPFNNGNGRTVRLLTYAMLVKYGFDVSKDRILNPTAVFCSKRESYYDFLSGADSGEDAAILRWCEYVLAGLKEEIEKIDRLLDYSYLKESVLFPALDLSLESKHITETEYRVLKRTIELRVVTADSLRDLLPARHSSERSRQIGKLIDKKMLAPTKERGRSYVLCFNNNYLLRGVIRALDKADFLP